MSKSTMDDLKAAILAVLKSATENNNECGNPIVDWRELYNLQSEYNIYFVEQDQQQVDLL